jgi:uncharacterized sulfatase
VVFGEIYTHDVADIDRPEASLEHRWCIAGDWKLIESADGKMQELYHLGTDPTELKDRSAEQPQRVVELSQRIKAAW